ncbi:hypothetical protein [Niveispirillum sp. KHB5.9]|uniref:hypothetical protein n=1 Tax=Niveispirillum sp. KHB5.9 TaxID=3400269 RepID=UPI003A84975F
MSPLPTPSAPDAGTLLDDLHARYDGRPPRDRRLVALAAGDAVLAGVASQAQCDRLLAEGMAARMALARRRRQLPAADAPGDPWLERLVGALRDARDGLVAG